MTGVQTCALPIWEIATNIQLFPDPLKGSVLDCPASEAEDDSEAKRSYRVAYMPSAGSRFGVIGPEPRPQDDIQAPLSRFAIVADGTMSDSRDDAWFFFPDVQQNLGPRHNGAANLLWADSHVSSLKPDDYASADWWKMFDYRDNFQP